MKTGFVNETWVAAYCHSCGEPFDNSEGEPALFPSTDAATEWLRDGGWLVVGDQITCDACVLAAHCAQHGHSWGDWKPWERLDRPHGFRRGRTRHCLHCDRLDKEYCS
ncbi:hypothetical protein [Nocardia concava]|uniref:hypothetical protein n=1 Tax=Nocardia concava TaxID=257281 RepID=UPI0002D493C8|nr:hypothetical protein [Nocardia concava]